MSNYKIGVNLRVTENSNQGGRKYMEDNHAIRFVKNDEGGFEFAYFGIFDGHGGSEASMFARDNLLDEITKYESFWSDKDADILEAIKTGFIDVHHGMWRVVDKWPKTMSGLPSTAGTTCTIGIIKNSKLYVGHVGDSGIALGFDDSKCEKFIRPRGTMLTIDHKPDSPIEKKRIEECGGQVVAKSGVQRVVWNRPKVNHKGPIRRSTPIDRIPFLAVARSLGDLWSYNYLNEEFVVSPEPDVSVHPLDPTRDKCLVIGSDGLWNMISAEEAVSVVVDLEYQFEYKVIHDPQASVSYWINPAEKLVNRALSKWRARSMKADNTSCVVVLIDPLGPRKLSILKKKREEHFKKVREMNARNTELGKKLTEDSKTGMRTSPRKSGEKEEAASTIPLPASQKVLAKGDKSQEDSGEKSWKDMAEGVGVAVKSMLSGDRARQSLSGSASPSLDDSVQAGSAHHRAAFDPSPAGPIDQEIEDRMNMSTISHNMPTVDVSPTKAAVVNTSNTKSFENQSLVLKKTLPAKFLPCTRTRQRHSSSGNSGTSHARMPDTTNVIQSVQKMQNTCDVMARDKKSASTVLTKEKRAMSMPVLIDSQLQSSNRIVSARECIKEGLRGAMKGIFNAGSSNLKVKTSSDLNKAHVRRHSHHQVQSTKGQTLRSSGKSDTNNSSHARPLPHSTNSTMLRMATRLRSGLRLKSGGVSKILRSTGQVENKKFVKRTRLAGTKRKADSPVDIATVKRLCRH
ncbi:protein phosphatase 1D-like [Ylistrum balloti]|uniref:protein phosphatase 1D-like n=1 Tax=Ylistrum balloti TaxID=509963 RepID=UPI002905E887|nr:protein phosphatase 1D-like [Ylistrum balloti]